MSVARKNGKRRPRGGGSVYGFESKQRWVGPPDLGAGPDGKRQRVHVTAATEAEAAERLRELRRQADAGADLTARRMTVADLLARWLSDLAPNRQSPKAELVELLREHRRRQAVERDVHGEWPAERAGLVFTTAAGTPNESRNLRRDVAALGRRCGVDKPTLARCVTQRAACCRPTVWRWSSWLTCSATSTQEW